MARSDAKDRPSDAAVEATKGERKRRRPKDRTDIFPPTNRSDAAEGLIPPSIFGAYCRSDGALASPPTVVPFRDGRVCVFVKTLGGLEYLVKQEAAVSFGSAVRDCAAVQGKIYLDLEVSPEEFPEATRKLLRLRTIESVHLVVLCADGIAQDATDAEQQLRQWAAAVDWRKCYAFWASATECGTCFEDVTFRCTGKRLGDQQWTSHDSQRWFGGAMQNDTHWKAQMKDFLVEVMPAVEGSRLVVSMRMSRAEGLGRRDIVHPGKTTLRGCLAHCLLKCAHLDRGDVVIDPMCGSAAVPVELAMSQKQCSLPKTHNLCGDVDLSVLPMVVDNLQHSGLGPVVDFMQLNCECLPFREGSLDVVVTDLPFGKRIGNYLSVKTFYPVAFRELARVTRPGTGRAVVLTHQYRIAMKSAMDMRPELWAVADVVKLNHGGLRCAIITVRRTAIPFPGHVSPPAGSSSVGPPEGAQPDPGGEEVVQEGRVDGVPDAMDAS